MIQTFFTIEKDLAMDIYSIWTGMLFAVPTNEGLLPEIEK